MCIRDSYWIPHYRSCGYLWAKDYGIDCTAFQPNHMFSIPEDEYDFGADGRDVYKRQGWNPGGFL